MFPFLTGTKRAREQTGVLSGVTRGRPEPAQPNLRISKRRGTDSVHPIRGATCGWTYFCGGIEQAYVLKKLLK